MNRMIAYLLFPATAALAVGIYGEYFGLRFPIDDVSVAFNFPFGQEANFLAITARLGQATASKAVLFIVNMTSISVALALLVGITSVLYVGKRIEAGSVKSAILGFVFMLFLLLLSFGLFALTANLNYSFLFESLEQNFRYYGSIISFCVLLSLLLSVLCQFFASIATILLFKLFKSFKG